MEKICICIKNIGVWHSFEKNKTATRFFLKKPFLVFTLQSDSQAMGPLYGEKREGQAI